MANSISKEYIIALSTKNLDDYKRVAFSSYSGTAYTDVCTNAFGLVKVRSTVRRPMYRTRWT